LLLSLPSVGEGASELNNVIVLPAETSVSVGVGTNFLLLLWLLLLLMLCYCHPVGQSKYLILGAIVARAMLL